MLSKEVFVYDYQGNYVTSYPSIKDTAYNLGLYHSTVKKCLHGEIKFAKLHQFSFTKVDKMEDLTEYSTGSSKEVLLYDTVTDEIVRFKSKVDCCKKLNLEVKSSGHKHLLGALNKVYGNRYKMFYNGEWTQSTYYNTGIIIYFKDSVLAFDSKKEFMEKYHIPLCYNTKDKFMEKFDEVCYNYEDVKFEQPLCEVTRIKNSSELLENP